MIFGIMFSLCVSLVSFFVVLIALTDSNRVAGELERIKERVEALEAK